MRDAEIVAERHRHILELARHTGSVSVDDLAARLAVTPQTIRKDLNALAGRAMLSRVHGGAVITSGVANIDYEQRRLVAADAKTRIGAAAAALIPNGASVFIGIGTTAEAVARALVHHRELMVVSNNLNIVDTLTGRPEIAVTAVGGRVRARDRAVVGALAVDFIRNFRPDFGVIGASGLDEDGGLLDFDEEEVQVSRAIIRSARRLMLVTDASKIGRPAPVRIAGLDELDTLVTDRIESLALRAACRAAEVELVETGHA